MKTERIHDEAFFTIGPGVEMCLLRAHPPTEAAASGLTFLIRMAEGARAVRHDHPGGEETYLLAGGLRIVARTSASGAPLPDAELKPGEYFYSPPGETHEGVAEEGALFFVVAPGGVARV